MARDITWAVLAALLSTACPSGDDDADDADHASSDADSSGSSDGPGESPGSDAPEICRAYSAHFGDCSRASEFLVMQAEGECAAQLHAATPYGEACSSATESLYECLAGADCGVLAEVDGGCPDERTAADDACQGGGGGSTSDG